MTGSAPRPGPDEGPFKILSKKHPCPDCKFCQCCSESKCAICRSSASSGKKKEKKSKVHKPLFLKF